MDDVTQRMISQMPLADAVFRLWGWTMSFERLQEIWDAHRGRCYDRVISFPVMVNLVADALVTYHSGRESFRKNIEEEVLEASIQAAYKKLNRLPIAVSQAFLLLQTRALREVFPEWAQWKRPRSLAQFHIATYDGKAIKRVAKRLKPLRGVKGGLLGGRALVAMDWDTGMVIAMHADPDGESNEVKFVKDLVPVVNQELAGAVLHVGDAAFCDLQQPQHFTAQTGHHFLVRHHPKVQFHADPDVAERHGTSYDGTPYIEHIGWIGSERDKRRRRVRQIQLLRPDQDPIALITDLQDLDRYPAADLLFVYHERWEIERVFQKVTEVFGLSALIGTSPQATLFQFAFCLVLYNMTQVIRGYVAQSQQLEPSQISTELMFRDVGRELNAWYILLDRKQTEEYLSDDLTAEQTKDHFEQSLRSAWTAAWIASPKQAIHRRTPRKRAKSHNSVQRILFGPPPKRKRKNLTVNRRLQQ